MKPNASVDTSWRDVSAPLLRVRAPVVNRRHNGRAGCCANSPGPESEPLVRRAEPMSERTCSVDDCPRTAHARGWCSHHYTNWWRRGDPLTEAPPKRGRVKPESAVPVSDRFWSKVDLSDPDGCWRWAGAYKHAYGEFWLDGKKAYAHRVAAMLVFGDLEDGETVLHVCDNPACVRPDHLRVGTQTDNMRDCGDKGRWRNQYAIGPNHPDLAAGGGT